MPSAQLFLLLCSSLLCFHRALSAPCSSPALRGDPGFTSPTTQNAPVYRAAYESFEKVPFSEAKFLACGETSKGYQLKEEEGDDTQARMEQEEDVLVALANFGTNLQCKYCLMQGCGYCFVSKKLVGESSWDLLFPGNLSHTNVSISNRSQCFYDPGGYLCSSRLETDSCSEHVPRYIDNVDDCYGGQQRNDIAYLGSLCAPKIAPQMLIPLRDSVISVVISDLRIDLTAHTFDSSVTFSLSWSDRRLADSFLNPCGSDWMQVEREVCGACDEVIFATALGSRSSAGACKCRGGGLVWNAVSAMDGRVFSNAVRMDRCATLQSDYQAANQSITRTFVCQGKFSMKLIPTDLNVSSAGKLDVVMSLSLSSRSTYGLRLSVDSSRVSSPSLPLAGFQLRRSIPALNQSSMTRWDSPILLLGFDDFQLWFPIFASFFPVLLSWCTFLLPPTQIDPRTRKDQQLSPILVDRILACFLALPCILQAAWRKEGESVPTDPIIVNMTMTLLLLLHAFVVTCLLLKRMAEGFPSRRQQDYNKRILLIVDLVDLSVRAAFPVLHLGILQRSLIVYFDQSHQVIAGSNAFLALSVLWYVSVNVLLLRSYFKQKQEDLRLLFELFDTDHGGTLSVSELDVALSNYGYEPFEKAEVMQMLLGGEWHKRLEAEVPLPTFLNVMGSPWVSLSMWLMSGKGARRRAEESLNQLNESKQEEEEEEQEQSSVKEGERVIVLPPVLHNFGREELERLESHLISKRAAGKIVKEVIESSTQRTTEALRTLHVVEQLNFLPTRSPASTFAAGKQLVRGNAALSIDRGWAPKNTVNLVRTIEPARKEDLEAVKGRIVDSLLDMGKEAERWRGGRSKGARETTSAGDDSSSVSSYGSEEETS
ncbi:hypothetical protein GUITHDRAFT_139884 [Guillardia theta CCMP2712]|uniref:EF-hand domain-containing protein n=1 Tax=Guillardia theta (strain CCMP2712) TaxID=905079 RepID=L1J754_GUITC|nr:hypothetical protein GUITHDRAFT_139884 [Guillardia theta CCMP2712]EKX44341.1 hypothetical protein GUITHDRAFT_139884 [Guillardia theta CCMP2712]|eukprot:XP_005831321.1 hypothetical protein GUITHDRAFT_139884 [Guillardia theta CCMP2712]